MTLKTTAANETVYYTVPADNIDLSNVKMYWDYDPVTGELGSETHNNSKVYSNAGKHYLVVISDNDLKFPSNHTSVIHSYTDISNHLIEIGKYKNYKPILVNKNNMNYFATYKKLQKITTGIFDSSVTYFGDCFYGCSSLTSIPEGLFDDNIKATSFNRCFESCSSLTSVPDGLFDNNTKVADFSFCFYNCSSLASVPGNLFDNKTKVTNFSCCFYNCSSLASIPEGLFNSNDKVTNFTHCFRNCIKVTGKVPELWDTTKWPNVTSHDLCFRGCTNATNYQDIPSDWK